MSSRAWTNVPIGLIVGAGLLLAAAPAAVQAQTETLTVQARIGEACTVTSASLDFGQNLNLAATTDAIGAIDITCAAQTDLNVALDGGLLSSGPGIRNMSSGAGSPISYHLFKNSARSELWGTGDQVAASISGSGGSVPVYGRVPSQPNGHLAGLYTDEVTITLNFQ